MYLLTMRSLIQFPTIPQLKYMGWGLNHGNYFVDDENLALIITIYCWSYNIREKFSPGPGFEPGYPALRAGAITTKPPR